MSSPNSFRLPLLQAAAAVLALVMIVFAILQLRETRQGLTVTRSAVGSIPITIYAPADGKPAPAVVIAHGFAGSQQLMQPFATTLARAGQIAITFDFPGHGRNPLPLPGGLADQPTMSVALIDALKQVVAHARTLPQVDGRVALLGHSMASDVVVQVGMDDPTIAATVAVSLFVPRATTTAPRNLLIIDGALEAQALIDEGFASLTESAGGMPKTDFTYGRFDDGSARRLVLARGAEHIGVLYARDSLDAAVAWLSQVFDRPAGKWRDTRGGALALLFGGLILLAWPLASRLPPASTQLLGLALGHRDLLRIAGLPAIATPLLLWPLPHDWLPLLLGGYLAMHFALYGLLMALLLRRRGYGLPSLARFDRHTWLSLLAVTLVTTLAFGAALDGWVASVKPIAMRLPLIAAMVIGLLPFFVIDEWITRGARPAAGAYALTKALLLASLLLAVALNLGELFFLIIIVPVILLLFIVFGLLGGWVGRRSGQPLITAFSNALLFGWLIAVSFPVVSQ
ncbi:alpha/beta hydrolase [uncultured Nevskia sp.]|uniref:serine aminopeptidase domain-containing protein n=1 Tax=uncultured Nevskia sp. TaxID=228950 RepID=UPI0025F4C84A|nr:alpha/beta hydrolase [uncultured Nevskia sp.]